MSTPLPTGGSTFKKVSAFADILMVLAMFAITAWAWPQIPGDARIPIHWGISGQVDGWGDKSLALLMMPVMMLFVDFVCRVALSAVDSAETGGKAKEFSYLTMSTIIFFMAIVHGLVVLTALGHNLPVPQTITAGIGLLFTALGALLASGKSERNPYFGVRTPWALQSDQVWYKTNRWGGSIMVAMGLALLAASAMNNMILIVAIILGGTTVLSIGSMVYSYRWRREELAGGK
ncbi:MAG: SdpI family protein [Cyanobacteria bacterium SZAS LIN-3]|nr:SdpI family protein [Cyanobacteria bacterium SZAS LIN-3]